MIDINKYMEIGGSMDVLQFEYPKFHTFTVTDYDYENGYAYRYFVQRISETSVIEISEINYNKLFNPLFLKLFITWHLIGPEKNVYVNGKLYEQGVYEKNLQEINTAAKSMPSIKNFITDYTQYRKDRKN